MNHISIPLAAVTKAITPPKPLTDEQKRKLGLAGPIKPESLKKLERKFAKPEKTGRTETVKSKDSNGWTKD